DLLDFARADSGVGPRSSDAGGAFVADVVDETIALVAPQRAVRDIALEADVARNLPAVHMSTTRLQQILLNLVFNAADAIAPGARDRAVSSREWVAAEPA